jgi:hypothetical protein
VAATPLNYTDGLTVIDAIKALDGVCDHATSKDGMGFSKFDREEHEDLIEKAISENHLSPKEETVAYRFLKRYKKQLKGLGINYDDIGHIPRPDNSDGNEDEKDSQEEINDRIPEWIEKFQFKTVTDTERLYRYDHGVYLDDGEIVLKALIEAEFGDITDDRLVKDVIGKVKRRTYVNRDQFNNRNVLNVKNGLLDLETLQIHPHTPDYLSTAQIDVQYNPEAKAPAISKFLGEVARSGDIPLIEEIIGWLLWPDYNVHKAVMLLGPGRNGKGTLLRLITAFLGKNSVSNVTLQEWLTGSPRPICTASWLTSGETFLPKISRTQPPSGTSLVVMITELRKSIILLSISGTRPSSCFRPMCCPGVLMTPMLTTPGGFSSNF